MYIAKPAPDRFNESSRSINGKHYNRRVTSHAVVVSKKSTHSGEEDFNEKAGKAAADKIVSHRWNPFVEV